MLFIGESRRVWQEKCPALNSSRVRKIFYHTRAPFPMNSMVTALTKLRPKFAHMLTKTFHSRRTLAALALLLQLAWPPAAAMAQTTAFTYQGQLKTSNAPAHGVFDCTFTLFRSDTGNNVVGATNVLDEVAVTNGLFTVRLDFLLESFETGADRWLEIAVRPGVSTGGYTALLPRQPLTPAPLAIFAARAGGADSAATLTGLVPATQISGTLPSANLAGTYSGALTLNNAANSFSGNGGNLTGLSASQLTSGTVPDARLAANVARTNQVWLLGGNKEANGAFLGTTDTNALEFHVNGQRAVRIEHATNAFDGYSPNIVAGHPNNFVSNGFAGAVIVGGGRKGAPNRVGGDYATVVGGVFNTASGKHSTAMGYVTTASGNWSIAMGDNTTASGSGSTAMGANTSASGLASTAMGGGTSASGNYSTAMGRSSLAQHQGTFVWADSDTTDFPSSGPNQFLIRASGGVGIGTANPNAPLHVTGGTDASVTAGGYLVLGRVNDPNLVFDDNEIMARDFGSPATLFLNANGGDVRIGTALGIGRAPATNALEVAGTASKSAAGSWLANSDARIKRDITPVTDALATLDKVRLVSFDYTAGYRAEHPEVESRRHLNVVAQEFREVFPEHVKSSGEKLPDGSEILQVDTYPLTIYSAAAVQELNRKLQTLEQQNAALLRRLEAMEARLK